MPHPLHRKDLVYCDLPMYTCPHCKQVSQKSDYFDIHVGTKFDCAACEKEIHVVGVDTTINVVLAKEPVPE
jgi:hypothetical protein